MTTDNPAPDLEACQHTRNPVCPHCGHIEHDAWDINFESGSEEAKEHYCGHCERPYDIIRTVSVTYSTSALVDQPTEHQGGTNSVRAGKEPLSATS